MLTKKSQGQIQMVTNIGVAKIEENAQGSHVIQKQHWFMNLMGGGGWNDKPPLGDVCQQNGF